MPWPAGTCHKAHPRAGRAKRPHCLPERVRFVEPRHGTAGSQGSPLSTTVPMNCLTEPYRDSVTLLAIDTVLIRVYAKGIATRMSGFSCHDLTQPRTESCHYQLMKLCEAATEIMLRDKRFSYIDWIRSHQNLMQCGVFPSDEGVLVTPIA